MTLHCISNLASEISADVILLDDNKARVIAQTTNFHVIGTTGILLDLKDRNIIRKVKLYLTEVIKYGRTRVPHPLNPKSKYDDIELSKMIEYRIVGVVPCRYNA